LNDLCCPAKVNLKGKVTFRKYYYSLTYKLTLYTRISSVLQVCDEKLHWHASVYTNMHRHCNGNGSMTSSLHSHIEQNESKMAKIGPQLTERQRLQYSATLTQRSPYLAISGNGNASMT
jgi:transposase-like protein